MPRAPDGTYTAPLPDVNPGEVVSSTWANQTIADISQALTDSLDRNGNGGMLAPFSFADGTVAAPGISWANEPSSGLYRAAVGDMRVALLGADIFRWNSGNAQLWTGSAWANVLTQGVDGTVPDGSNEGETLRWDNAGEVWVVSDDLVVNLDGTVSVKTDLSVGADIIVTGLVDGRDVDVDGAVLDATAAALTAHEADTDIHFADSVAADGQVRVAGGWVNGLQVVNDAGAAQAQPTDVQVLTQAEYDGLTPDANTLYYIVG